MADFREGCLEHLPEVKKWGAQVDFIERRNVFIQEFAIPRL